MSPISNPLILFCSAQTSLKISDEVSCEWMMKWIILNDNEMICKVAQLHAETIRAMHSTVLMLVDKAYSMLNINTILLFYMYEVATLKQILGQ